jgi:DNA-binding winged helix-turn-helix (wHTH) protein
MKVFPPFRLDTVNQCLWRRAESGQEKRISLAPKVFGVLRYLVEHSGRLVTHDELLNALWPDTYVQPEVLKNHILEVRNVLGDRARNSLFVETLPRRGYQFIAPVHEAALADPVLPLRLTQGQLVGREQPLSDLRGFLQKALQSRRQIVFVTGEPGIGKTALVDEFHRQAAIDVAGIRVARGQCVEGYGGKEAYYPVLEALGQLFHGPKGELVVQILARQAPTWLVQYPAFVKREQRETLQREILGATRERMLREIGEAFETITSQTPLLLVLEDLQWVDPSTIDLLSSLARRRGPAKLMLVGTYRPVDVVVADHPLKAVKQDLLVHELCHEIRLHSLGETEVARYLATDSFDAFLPDGLAALVHRHSEGNPLFMVAALDHMIQRGLISREGGRWQLSVPIEEIDLQVPESLRQMIELQIERLSHEEQQVLEAASVNGVVFTLSVSAAAANLEVDRFEDLCEELSRRHQIVRAAGVQEFPNGTASQRYEFQHALYREVFYRRQAAGRRMKLHRHVGERLETLFAERLNEAAPELAEHFEEGNDWDTAVKYLQLAADTAGRRFERRQSTSILKHALELVKKLPEADRAKHEITILERLATIYLASLDSRAVEVCETLVSRAAQHGLVDIGVSALLKMAWQLLWMNSEKCLNTLHRALQLSAGDKDSLLHARAVLTCSFCNVCAAGWNARHVEDCRNALEVIRRRADRLILGPNLIDYSYIQWFSSEYCGAYQNAIEGLAAIFEEAEANPYLNDAYLHQMIVPWSLLFMGEWGKALREVDRAAAMMDRNADDLLAQSYRLFGAWVNYHALDFAGVMKICEPRVALLKNLDEYQCYFRFGSILMAAAELNLGNYERTHVLLCAAQEEIERLPLALDWLRRVFIESVLTDLWLAEGDVTQARIEVEKLLMIALETAERTWQAVAWEASARVAMAEHDAKRAQDNIEKALSTMEGFDLPLAAWRVHASAAELYEGREDGEQAQHHRDLSRAGILRLANSLPADEPLRRVFLSAQSVRKVLRDHDPTNAHAGAA